MTYPTELGFSLAQSIERGVFIRCNSPIRVGNANAIGPGSIFVIPLTFDEILPIVKFRHNLTIEMPHRIRMEKPESCFLVRLLNLVDILEHCFHLWEYHTKKKLLSPVIKVTLDHIPCRVLIALRLLLLHRPPPRTKGLPCQSPL